MSEAVCYARPPMALRATAVERYPNPRESKYNRIVQADPPPLIDRRLDIDSGRSEIRVLSLLLGSDTDDVWGTLGMGESSR